MLLLAVVAIWVLVYSTSPFEGAPHNTLIPVVPSEVNFCDEPVPIDREDVFESFDREIIVNTFYHSSTILIVKRSARYFPIIEPILEECGIPNDFKYLCAIESTLSPQAKSPAGAVGLWQIMEATGKELGLVINDEVDERYDAVKSTYAACAFLQKAYAKFGSWTLVAASYNGGQGRVDRNMNQQYQSNYYDLLFGEETGRYVYRILAIKTILNSPQQYGFNIDSLSVYPTFESSPIMVDSTIDDIAQWAVEQGTSYKNVKRFNPWLRQNKLTVAKGKSYSIYLPLIADTCSVHR